MMILNNPFITNLIVALRHAKTTANVWMITGIALCAHLLFYLLSDQYHIDDAPSYRNALNLIENNSIDVGRTPVYPTIIALVRSFCSEPLLTHVIVLVQIVVFFLTIPLFKQVTIVLTKSVPATFFITLVYACCPHIAYWNRSTLTESLAISGIVFLVYFMVQFVKTNKIIYAVAIQAATLALIMLRPAFLYLIPAMLIFWIGFGCAKNQNVLRNVKWGGLFLLTCTAVYLYARTIEKKTGVFSLTTVSTINMYSQYRQFGILNDSISYPLIVADVNNFQNLADGEDWIALTDKYQFDYINDFLISCRNKNPGKYLKGVLVNVQQNSRKLVFIPGGFKENDNSSPGTWILHAIVALNIFFLHLYIFLALYPFLVAYGTHKKWKQMKLPFLLWMLACAHLATVFLGSYGQFSRLTAPIYPLIILMAGHAACFVKVKIKQYNHDGNS
jgi:hypothetical protein